MCFIDNRGSRTTKFLLDNGFKQPVNIDGGHIDYDYLTEKCSIPVLIEVYSLYHTAKDHDTLCSTDSLKIYNFNALSGSNCQKSFNGAIHIIFCTLFFRI